MIRNKQLQELISNIVEKIEQGCHPNKIILFGSCSQGNPSIDSDIDLLVIKDSSERRDQRDVEIRKQLKDIKFPLDIFVYTPKEVEMFRHIKGSFINKIFSSGEVLYG